MLRHYIPGLGFWLRAISEFGPMDLILDYMILGYLRAKGSQRIYLYLNGLRSSQVQLFVETKEVAIVDLKVMIKLDSI